MYDSDKLFYAYCVGAAITVVLGLWLSHRDKIDTPVFLTILTSHEFALLMLAVFWPILGRAVLLEIGLRSWVRRGAQDKASKMKLATTTKPPHQIPPPDMR